MIFDQLGLPKDTGASDLQDSARLAGIMITFNYPAPIDLFKYVDVDDSRYVRHPKEYIYDFSRDQALCLMAGLATRKLYFLVNRNYVSGKDIFSPSHWGHVKRCQGSKANFFQDAWLWVDVLYSCHVKPMSEPNQILCMLKIAPKKFLLYWLKNNKVWREAIREYWCGWRGETELAEHMIKNLENELTNNQTKGE